MGGDGGGGGGQSGETVRALGGGAAAIVVNSIKAATAAGTEQVQELERTESCAAGDPPTLRSYGAAGEDDGE